jgi:hypothetical protein
VLRKAQPGGVGSTAGLFNSKDISMKIFAAIFAGALLLSGAVLAHETMGHFMDAGQISYLYGKKIDADTDDKINCCKFEGGGDCKTLADSEVQVVPGGFIWEGDFIPYSRSNISPPDPVTGEYHYYGCKHPPNSMWGEKPKPHCFFHIPSGS